MPKVGDTVTVQIRGAPEAGTSVGSGLTVGPGAAMSISGKIVEDLGDHWVVQLGMSVGGKNRILVPKAAQRRA